MSALMSTADVAAHEAASYVRPKPRPVANWDDDGPLIPKIPGPRQPSGNAGDSDPDADELLKRVKKPRSNYSICPDCPAPWHPGHTCAPRSPSRAEFPAGFSSAGREALRRSYAATEKFRQEEIDAAYAELAAQPLAAYNEWAAEVPA